MRFINIFSYKILSKDYILKMSDINKNLLFLFFENTIIFNLSYTKIIKNLNIYN